MARKKREAAPAAAPANGLNGHATGGNGATATNGNGAHADAGGEGVTVTVRTPRARPGAAPGRKGPPVGESHALRELALFARTGGVGEIHVERVGPADYHGEPVQLAHCGSLPPDTASLFDAIRQRWKGGHYEVRAERGDGQRQTALIKIAGRPAPLDAEEERDAQAARERAIGGGAFPGAFPYGAPGGAPGGGAQLGMGWVWVPAHQDHYWTGPGPATTPPPQPPVQFNHPPAGELAEARKKIEELERAQIQNAHHAELAAIRAELAAIKDGGGSGGGGIGALLNASMEQQRLANEREEAAREARMEREREDRKDEREQRRLDAEARQKDADRMTAQMQEAQRANMTLLTTLMTSNAGKDPLDGMSKGVQVLAALRDFGGEPSKVQELERGAVAIERLFANAVGHWRGQSPPQLTATNPPAASSSGASAPSSPAAPAEADPLVLALDYMLGCFRKKRSPSLTFHLLVGFCDGKGINPGEAAKALLAFDHASLLGALEQVTKGETDPARLATARESREALANDKGRAWYEAVQKEAAASLK
jgi:hypothetical protein